MTASFASRSESARLAVSSSASRLAISSCCAAMRRCLRCYSIAVAPARRSDAAFTAALTR